jgi:hypothetical protein
LKKEYVWLGYTHAETANDIDARLDRLERALEVLASEPGQPHSSGAEALKILNQED